MRPRDFRSPKNRGVLPAYAEPSISGLFLFLDTVDASDGVGEVSLLGDDVPSFIRFGLDSHSAAPEDAAGSELTTIELCSNCTKLGLDSPATEARGLCDMSVVGKLDGP